jgi:hypothetical protein
MHVTGLIVTIWLGRKLWAWVEKRNRIPSRESSAATSKVAAVEETLAEVVALVERHLERNQPAGYRLFVRRDQVVRRDGWWYVPVKADWAGVPVSEYADRLQEIEIDLRDATKKKIVLTTRLPVAP